MLFESCLIVNIAYRMTEPSTSEQTECHKRHITFHKQMQDLRQVRL